MTWLPLVQTQAVRNGQPVPDSELGENTTYWINDKYHVHRRVIPHEDPNEPPMIHLSIRNANRSARHDWRDFQRIKNQLAGPEYEGVELYPAESRKVDTSNQYHLWCLPFQVGFGFMGERMVTDSDVTAVSEPGAVQRDNEPIDGPLNTLDDINQWQPRGT